MILLLAKKIGMTQLFDNNNNLIPITIIETKLNFITNIKKLNNFNNIKLQIGFFENFKNNKKNTKSYIGYFIKKNLIPVQYLKEFKISNLNNYYIGKIITNDIFNLNDKLTITSNTIGKGFTGNIKKHHFKRGPETHGSKHHRLQGSLGAGTTPGRVFPGKKMASRLGNNKCTIKNLKIFDIQNNLILIKGCIPGKTNQLIYIKK
jgi:large subunit ribosomal protein L3